jgi:hypothetical protein
MYVTEKWRFGGQELTLCYGIGNLKITTILGLSDNKLTKFAAKTSQQALKEASFLGQLKVVIVV